MSAQTAKFTPGPWRAEPDGMGDITIGSERDGLAIAAVVNGSFMAMGGLSEEHEANARLIAASPDLLAALIDLDARLRECGALHTAEDAYDSFYQEMVADAIARATGEGK